MRAGYLEAAEQQLKNINRNRLPYLQHRAGHSRSGGQRAAIQVIATLPAVRVCIRLNC
jgi:hypothetical protein